MNSILLTLTALAGIATPKEAPTPDDLLAFPAASTSITIRAGGEGSQEGTSLLDLLKAYEGATNQHFVLSRDAMNQLRTTPVGVLSDLELPADRLQESFEHILVRHNFVLQVLTTQAPRLLSVTNINTREGQVKSREARFISAERLSEAAMHPAMVFQTVMTLPEVDVRQLTNAMRAVIPDPNTTGLIAVSTSRLVLRTTGDRLKEYALTLLAAGKDQVQFRTQAPAQSQTQPQTQPQTNRRGAGGQ